MDKSLNKETLEAWDDRYLWHPFTPHAVYRDEKPLLFVEGEGNTLIDIDGRRYIDAISSMWCAALGHRHPTLDKALSEQLGRLAHATMLGNATEPAIRLGRELIERMPDPLRRVFYSDNGSTAVEIALKMAYQFRQNSDDPRQHRKQRFLAFTSAYNGDTLGAVSVGGIDLYHERFRHLLFKVERAPSPYCYRCPLSLERSTCQEACLHRTLELIMEHADTLTAVVVEPGMLGAGGILTYPEGWLKALRKVTEENDIFLIADEVATGYGRGGALSSSVSEGVVPDFVCFSKMLTGGYLPLAATLTTERVFEAFIAPPEEGKTFFHGHTYTGNPLGAAAALAVLDVFDRESTLDHARRMGEKLHARLKPLAEHPWVGDIRTWGLAAGLELVRDKASKEPWPAATRMGHRVCRRMRERGVFTRPLHDVVVLMPPLSIQDDEVDTIVDALAWALEVELNVETSVPT